MYKYYYCYGFGFGVPVNERAYAFPAITINEENNFTNRMGEHSMTLYPNKSTNI